VIICDTGPLVALLNKKDDDHAACASLFARYPGRLVVPGPILTEVCYMAESRLGSETEASDRGAPEGNQDRNAGSPPLPGVASRALPGL
jgi:predicted nucleic acid-binding protein